MLGFLFIFFFWFVISFCTELFALGGECVEHVAE